MKNSKTKISPKLKKLLVSLGCEEVRLGIFKHPDIKYDLDFSSIADDKIVLRFSQIFSYVGQVK